MQSPLELGRSLVAPAGVPVPAGWAGRAEYRVDDDLLDDQTRLAEVVLDLHRAWVARQPFVVRLEVSDARLAEAQTNAVPPWELGGEFTFLRERLHHLVWVNSYDARHQPPVWWWARKSLPLGASLGGGRDIVLADGIEAWVDGGPRGDAGRLGLGAVVHCESVLDGHLSLVPEAVIRAPGLAPDQAEAVLHGAGAARVIAPAGSGKTRTLAARLVGLVDELGYPVASITAVAYNNRAAAELAGRVGGAVAGSVRTLHALGRAILFEAAGRLDLLSERDVRRMLDPMVPALRRPNTDAIGPYLEGFTEVRIGLRSPSRVESERDDVPGFAEVFDRYRRRLKADRVHDFDEQVFGAIEALLADPRLRSRWQASCRHLLVDEFQDLTPAYLLLIRLLASPGLDVFGVGDDDQVIYGYAGADPLYLIEFDRLFPGAGHHALEVNYRCPRPVVEAASLLLGYNRRRIDKTITPHREGDAGLEVRLVDAAGSAGLVVSTCDEWVAEGATLEDIVVLCRVNSALLPVHAALVDAATPLRSPIGPAVLSRTVISAALAWLRIGMDPDQIDREDLFSVIRRPSRGLARVASDLIGGRRTISGSALRGMTDTLDGKQSDRWRSFCTDVDQVVSACATGDTRRAVETLRSDIGLERAAAALDSGRTSADRSGQSDDLQALGRVAALHPALGDFEPWLRGVVAVGDTPGGILLTTVHRVKGLEWDNVIVYGADTGLMPHDLSEDLEEERRIFHVAITRGRNRVMVIADRAHPSRFVAEMTGSAPQVEEPPIAPTRRRVTGPVGIQVTVGDRIGVAGGFTGVVERMTPIGVMLALDPGPGKLSVKWGEQVSSGGAAGPLSPAEVAADPALVERIKLWRRGLSAEMGVPAYVILTDASIDDLARRRPRNDDELLAIKGIGPAKLEAYGDELLALVAEP
jgi:DNA helicase-2/ATP-dependent DNA helicase PcrA